MGIASSLFAEKVNNYGEAAIKEMQQLKSPHRFTVDKAIDDCIAIVKKYFTGWTE